MLIGQSTRTDRSVCWSVGQPGWVHVGKYGSWGVNEDRWSGILVGESTWIDRLVCWSFRQPR